MMTKLISSGTIESISVFCVTIWRCGSVSM